MFDTKLLCGLPADYDVFRLLLQHVPGAVAIFDLEMRYLACSPRWLSDHGLTHRSVVGLSHYEVFPQVDERWRAVYARALAGETQSSALDGIPRADGTVDWVRWTITPWHDANGEIAGVILATEVLTASIERQQRAELLQQQLDLMVDSTVNYGLCMLDTEGRVIIWNTGAIRLYQWTEAEMLGRHFEVFFPPAQREAGEPGRQLEYLRKHKALQDRGWRQRKDGSRFLAQVDATRVDDANGKHLGFAAIVHDITADDANIQALAAREAMLRSILATVPDGLFVIDERSRIVTFNAAAERMFGYAANEVIGHNVSMLMTERDQSRYDGYIARYHATSEPSIISAPRRVSGRRKDGTVFPHLLFIDEVVASEQRMFTGFVHDLTEHDEAEARSRELQSELMRVSRVGAAGTLASALAHELNQPLAAIANYVQSANALLGADEGLSVDLLREALVEAGKEALRAGAVVRRLREFIGRGELQRTNESPAELVSQAVSLSLLGMRNQGITCRTSVPADLKTVLVDRIQIQQVLLNLVRNALEAMAGEGHIDITVTETEGKTCFTVADDGPGIPSDSEPDLFEPFFSSKASGMGIGLSICRRIVEAHGGRLWYDARTVGGANFHFTVPIADGVQGHD